METISEQSKLREIIKKISDKSYFSSLESKRSFRSRVEDYNKIFLAQPYTLTLSQSPVPLSINKLSSRSSQENLPNIYRRDVSSNLGSKVLADTSHVLKKSLPPISKNLVLSFDNFNYFNDINISTSKAFTKSPISTYKRTEVKKPSLKFTSINKMGRNFIRIPQPIRVAKQNESKKISEKKTSIKKAQVFQDENMDDILNGWESEIINEYLNN